MMVAGIASADSAMDAGINRFDRVQQQNNISNRMLIEREIRYEDANRSIDLESRRLDLDAKRIKVSRTDDYVDAELHGSYTADANSRDIAKGQRSMLSNAGTPDVHIHRHYRSTHIHRRPVVHNNVYIVR